MLYHVILKRVLPVNALILFSVLLSVKVLGQAPLISYPSSINFIVNKPITNITPQNTGGAVPAAIYGQVSTFPIYTFSTLTGVAIDASDNIYLQDWGAQKIKKYSSAGVLSEFAGNGSTGFSDGQGSAATFNQPNGMVVDDAGNVFVSDMSNHAIRKITPSGLVSTLAGSGISGTSDGSGASARFYTPRGLAIDANGSIFVADQANNKIRKVTTTGVVTTVAGTGMSGFTNGPNASATFNTPTGVGLDKAGNLYVADAGNNAVRKIAPTGVVSTFATGFDFTREVRIDAGGYAYVCSQNNNKVFKISPQGMVAVLAGSGQSGASDGIGTQASFHGPRFMAIANDGNLLVSDGHNNLLRKVLITGYVIDKPLPVGLTFDPTTGTISGTPTTLTAASDYTITAFNKWGNSKRVIKIAVVNIAPSIITFPPTTVGDIDVNNILQTHVSSTNTETPITFTSSNPSVAYVGADGQIHVIAPGNTIITAYQEGNQNFLPAVPVQQYVTITQNQFVFFPDPGSKYICDADFSIEAITSNPVMPLVYTSSNPSVATISSQGVIHIVSSGTSTITVSQPGNVLYNPAIPFSRIVVISQPIVPVISINPDTSSVCEGNTVSYTALVINSTGSFRYQWYLNGQKSGSDNAVFTYLPKSSDVVKCEVTNLNACNAMGTSNPYSNLIVNSLITPVVSIQPAIQAPFCVKEPVTFQATAGDGVINPVYKWKVNNVEVGENKPLFTSSELEDGDVVTCTLTAGNPCLTIKDVVSNAEVVRFYPEVDAPEVAIATSATQIYQGVSAEFFARTLNTGSSISYQWQINGINVGEDKPAFTSKELHNLDKITCTIITNIPCSEPVISNEIEMSVLPATEIEVPNTFTPNADGINDTWNIATLLYYPACTVQVFNRNGSMVFESKGYRVPWDGRYRNELLPEATYYYLIYPTPGSRPAKGSVSIIR